MELSHKEAVDKVNEQQGAIFKHWMFIWLMFPLVISVCFKAYGMPILQKKSDKFDKCFKAQMTNGPLERKFSKQLDCNLNRTVVLITKNDNEVPTITLWIQAVKND